MGQHLRQHWVVFYNNFETREQGPAKTIAEALAQVKEYEDATHVYRLNPDGTFQSSTKTVALLYFEEWIKDHDHENDHIPEFINKNLTNSDMDDIIAERKSWNVS